MPAPTDQHVTFLERLPLSQKLALVVAAMAIPAVMLGCFYFRQTAVAVEQARGELQGARSLRALGGVTGELLTHRGREYTFLSGDKNRRADVLAQEAEVDRQIASVAELGLDSEWRSFESEWAALKANGLQQTAEQNDAAHAALAKHLTRIAEDVSSRSLATSDPESSTRSLLRIASNFAPDLALYSSNIRRHAVHAASKGYLGGDDRMGIRVFHERREAELDSLKGALEQVSPDARREIQEAVTTAQRVADEFYGLVQAKILNAGTLEITGAATYDAGVQTNRALKKVSLLSYDMLAKQVEQRLASATRLRMIVGACTALALAFALTLAVLIKRALANPLHRAISVFSEISDGRYGNEITVPGTDEASQVLNALATMQGTLRTQTQMQAMLSAVNNGNLSSRISMADKTDFFQSASSRINHLADNMAEILSQVQGAAGEVYRGAQEIASGNNNLQHRTEEQSASLEETASSMEQMTTTVRQNADNAGEANQLAVAARDQAERGGKVVGQAIHAMTEINAAARKIAAIIGVVDEIAFQTNLLALNAAVEAARAGEQGRGFAVVATEVRTLAGRSATAARQIKELIADSVQKVADGSVFVSRSGQTLEQIVTSVKKVSDIVAEIAAASREQSAGIAQVNRAVLQMDELTQQNAALVEQVTTASQSMAHEAQGLHELLGGYQLGAATETTSAQRAA